MEQVSTIVVINGEAIIAGSKPTRFAKSGKIQPINLERITVTRRCGQFLGPKGTRRRKTWHIRNKKKNELSPYMMN